MGRERNTGSSGYGATPAFGNAYGTGTSFGAYGASGGGASQYPSSGQFGSYGGNQYSTSASYDAYGGYSTGGGAYNYSATAWGSASGAPAPPSYGGSSGGSGTRPVPPPPARFSGTGYSSYGSGSGNTGSYGNVYPSGFGEKPRDREEVYLEEKIASIQRQIDKMDDSYGPLASNRTRPSGGGDRNRDQRSSYSSGVSIHQQPTYYSTSRGGGGGADNYYSSSSAGGRGVPGGWERTSSAPRTRSPLPPSRGYDRSAVGSRLRNDYGDSYGGGYGGASYDDDYYGGGVRGGSGGYGARPPSLLDLDVRPPPMRKRRSSPPARFGDRDSGRTADRFSRDGPPRPSRNGRERDRDGGGRNLPRHLVFPSSKTPAGKVKVLVRKRPTNSPPPKKRRRVDINDQEARSVLEDAEDISDSEDGVRTRREPDPVIRLVRDFLVITARDQLVSEHTRKVAETGLQNALGETLEQNPPRPEPIPKVRDTIYKSRLRYVETQPEGPILNQEDAKLLENLCAVPTAA